MATKLFLGEPPAHIKQWIIDHYGSKFPNMEMLPIMSSSNFNPESHYTMIINSDESIKGNILYKNLINNLTK